MILPCFRAPGAFQKLYNETFLAIDTIRSGKSSDRNSKTACVIAWTCQRVHFCSRLHLKLTAFCVTWFIGQTSISGERFVIPRTQKDQPAIVLPFFVARHSRCSICILLGRSPVHYISRSLIKNRFSELQQRNWLAHGTYMTV